MEGVYQWRLAYQQPDPKVRQQSLLQKRLSIVNSFVSCIHVAFLPLVVSSGFSVGICVPSQQGFSASFIPGLVVRLCPLRI